jgi:hypothetical protein
MPTIAESYIAGRAELASSLLNSLRFTHEIYEVIRRIFWSPAYCDTDGLPQPILPGKLEKLLARLLPDGLVDPTALCRVSINVLPARTG